MIKTGAMCVCVSQGVSLRGGGRREEQKLKTEREREKKNIKSFKKNPQKKLWKEMRENKAVIRGDFDLQFFCCCFLTAERCWR